jgi:hypothetical protein
VVNILDSVAEPLLTRRRFTGALGLAVIGVAAPAHAQHADHRKGMGKEPRPHLAISAAFAPNGDLWVVGLDDQRRLTLRTSRDDGRTWSNARALDIGRDTVAAEGESRPKLLFGPKGWVVISYTQPLSKPYTGEIRMLRSGNGGRTFSAPFTVHRDRQLITHRFESIAFDATGALHTFWVDKRDAEAARAEATASGAKSAYAGAAVYRNVSLDGGATFGPDTRLADHSCECCRIALAPDNGGGLVAFWRHVFEDNVRDHAFARIAPRGEKSTPAIRATFDEWSIDACPHHGPGLAAAVDGGFHAVWFGDRDGEAAVRYVRLNATGQPIDEPRPLPDAFAEHATVASAGDGLAIVWRSFDGSATRLGALVSIDAGKTFEIREIARTTGDNDHPLLVRKGKALYAVWRTTQETLVERLLS